MDLHTKMRVDLEALEAEMGAEAIDGLYSMYEGGEELTCFTAKKLLGKRDKRYGERAFGQ